MLGGFAAVGGGSRGVGENRMGENYQRDGRETDRVPGISPGIFKTLTTFLFLLGCCLACNVFFTVFFVLVTVTFFDRHEPACSFWTVGWFCELSWFMFLFLVEVYVSSSSSSSLILY